MPAAEVDVSDDLVRALLAHQHPDLAARSVCAGDPATDLSCAWGLFDDPVHRDVLRSAAGDVDALGMTSAR